MDLTGFLKNNVVMWSNIKYIKEYLIYEGIFLTRLMTTRF